MLNLPPIRKRRRWRAPKLSLRTVALAFAAQIVLVVVAVGALSLHNGRLAVDELAKRLTERATQELQLEIAHYFDVPQNANHAVKVALETAALDLDDRPALARLFAQQLEFFNTAETVQIATVGEDWRYFGVGYARTLAEDGLKEDDPVVKRADREAGKSTADFVQYRYRSDGTTREELDRREGYDLNGRDWYANAVASAAKSDAFTWSPVYTTVSARELGIMGTDPLFDSEGRLVAIVGTDLRLGTLAGFLAKSAPGDNGKAYLLERKNGKPDPIATSDGEIFRTAEDGSQVRLTLADLPLLKSIWTSIASEGGLQAGWDAFFARAEVRSISIGGQDYFVHCTSLKSKLGLDWALVSVVSPDDFSGRIREQMQNQTLALCAFALILAMAIVALIRSSIGLPILALSGMAHRLSNGNFDGNFDRFLSARIRPRLRIHEIELLRDALEKMRYQLQASLDHLTAEIGQSQERFASTFRESPHPSVIVDRRDGKILQVNKRFISLFEVGEGKSSSIGETEEHWWAEPEQRQRIKDRIDRGDEVQDVEAKFSTATGKIVTVLLSATPIELEGVPCLMATATDISERRKLESKLRAQREAAPDGILIWDENSRIATRNQRFLDLWEIDPAMFEDVEGEPDAVTQAVTAAMCARLKDPQEFSSTLDFYREYRTRPDRQQDIELQLPVQGDRIFERHSAPIFSQDSTKEFFGRIWFFRDVTDLRQRERKARENEAYVRMILDNIPQQVFWKNKKLVFQGCNTHWAKAAGLESPDDAIGKTDFSLLPQELAQKFRAADRAIIENNAPVLHVQAEKSKPGEDGKKIWLDISKLPIHNEDGNVIGILGVIDDITIRREAEEALRKEQERSEELLLNILPESIAASLKVEQRSIAKSFKCASILFADIVGFTPLSAELEPIELVDLLNQIFSIFDSRARYHGLEKIKTIGDAYMVAGGLPIENANHINAIAEMALEMQEAVQKLREQLGLDLSIRVGIHIGPVVAGVIGAIKFTYDLWGDTVNIASRMESSGEPDCIQISEATYQAIHTRYECEPRGTIEVKGKGEMKTYWLKDRNGFFQYRSDYDLQHEGAKLEEVIAEVHSLTIDDTSTIVSSDRVRDDDSDDRSHGDES